MYLDIKPSIAIFSLLGFLSALELGYGPYLSEVVVERLDRPLTQKHMSLNQLEKKKATPHKLCML